MDVVDNEGYTPLLRAIWKNHQPIVEVLLAHDHGAAVNGPVGACKTPLQQACRNNGNEDIVRLLLGHGADANATTLHGRKAPLTIAYWSHNRNLAIVHLLIKAGADVNDGNGGIAPLHEAAYFGDDEAIELLIEAGADVNILSSNRVYLPSAAVGSTPLHFAAKGGHLSSLNILLAAGADPNIVNELGETPLHFAARRSSDVDVVKTLLAAGCHPLHRDNYGRTPLHYFSCGNIRFFTRFSTEHFKVITTLVAAGDRSWQCVPTPCPGLEAAMLSVWQAAPDEMPELVKRLENPPSSLIELFPRLDDVMKKLVQEVLRGLHHHYAGLPHLQKLFLNSIFGHTTI